MSITSSFYKKDEFFWRNLSIRAAFVLLTTLLIVWFLPRNEGRKFDYEVGEPWHYGTIIAKYDFPVYKTEEALARERDSLLRQFQPYYDYNSIIEAEEIAKLRQDLRNNNVSLPAGFEEHIIDRLHRFYQSGIMETPTYNRIHADTTNQVRIVFGKDAESVNINSIFSTMSAYEQLLNDERFAQERSLLQRLNLNNYIVANLIYDKARTESAKNDLLSGISPASGIVMSGQRIIGQGEIVNEYSFRVLNSMQKEIQRRSASKTQLTYNLIGNTAYVFILVLLFTMYLGLFRRDYFEKMRNIAMLYVLITIFPVLVSLMIEHTYFNFSVYILPFAFVPIFIRVFMDSRTAFLTHITMVLICASALRYQFDFIIIQTVAGLVTIYSLREMSSRAQVFRTALWVFLATCITYLTLKLMESSEEFNFESSMYYHFLINGVLLLLAYPMMFLVEKTFDFISVITLIELSDTNKGLLRKLSEEAPGTFQHSITVGNLASEIANKIGAKSTLVRTGALYHDIGKILSPAFFTENQQGGVNPHDSLTYKESAQIIIAHVNNGVKLAEENNLPVVIREFILTHHGRGLAKYFYINYQNEHPDEIVDKEPFTYPGPNPSTREQAILMMADPVEAATKSLKNPTFEALNEFVDRIIKKQLDDNQFANSDISFKEIEAIKRIFKSKLTNIYHVRIEYPE